MCFYLLVFSSTETTQDSIRALLRKTASLSAPRRKANFLLGICCVQTAPPEAIKQEFSLLLTPRGTSQSLIVNQKSKGIQI